MKIFIIIVSTILISSFASVKTSKNLYSSADIGKAITIKSCTVVSSRSVIIRDNKSGSKGEGLGFIAGSLGAGRHNKPLSGFIGGLVGGAIGRQVSDYLHERDGVEYTVVLRNGDENQLVQDLRDDEDILISGDACRIQVSNNNNRVLPANHFPSNVKRHMKTGFTDN